ncbi:MAG: GNAT family N-acetyltransferase [Methylomonas sp.]|nr:GNAT family N-acetyltransferase [Methylomonas sp.]
MQIHIATEADIPELCTLLAELFRQEAEFSPDSGTQARGLRSIVENPAIGHIFVVKQQDRAIAMVSLLYSVSTALGGRVAWLEDMVVGAESRTSGIGSALLQHALEYARRNGCLRVTLLTDRDNQAAQRFYQRQGFSASEMLPMRLLLD